MASNQKPVIVRRLSGDWLSGYANPRKLVEGGTLEILDQSGKVLTLPLSEIKLVSFVRDFGLPGESSPEKMARKTFAGRPRVAGIMVRIHFKDSDTLEGLAANDRSLLENEGLLLTPPDLRSNVQRMYVPRQAIAELEILAVIHAPKARVPRPTTLQDDLFATLPVSNTRLN
jgi:hypothetical protein